MLFLRLTVKQLAHLFLLGGLSFHLALLVVAFTHLLLHLVTHERVVLVLLLLALVLDHSARHPVHEFLGAAFAGQELVLPVELDLLQDARVFFLSLDILLPFAHLLGFGLLLVGLVLEQHLLEVVALLVALVRLQLAFSLHLSLQSLHEFHLTAEGLLLVMAARAFLFV